MKITIDKAIPPLTEEEIEDYEAKAKPVSSEEAKKHFLGKKEIILSEQVLAQIKELGMTPDEFVAMLMKGAGASQ